MALNTNIQIFLYIAHMAHDQFKQTFEKRVPSMTDIVKSFKILFIGPVLFEAANM